MRIKLLKDLSYLYLVVPIILFVIGWLKPAISIPITIVLILILFEKIREKDEDAIFISKKNALIVLGIVFLICITAGQGNLFYQSNDWHWRNAIFRDMINYDWPIYYKEINASMSYYIGFWIVPAIIGKIFLYLFGENIAWMLANLILLIWCSIGVSLSLFWVIKIVKICEIKKILFTILFFLGFSGLDIFGVLITENKLSLMDNHLEWWAMKFQFSSMITQLFWVFNQSVVAWLITAMFFEEKKVNNYMLLILLLLPYGPLPFIGLIPIMGVSGFIYMLDAVKNRKWFEFLRDVFSIQNICAFISIFPIYYLYYSSNVVSANHGFSIDVSLFNLESLFLYIIFYLLEIGIYGYLLLIEYNKETKLKTALLSLLLIPMFIVGIR